MSNKKTLSESTPLFEVPEPPEKLSIVTTGAGPAPKLSLVKRASKPPAGTPQSLLATAIQTGLSIEHLDKLLDMQQRWEAKEARKAFFNALSQFQYDCPEIKKTKKVSFEHRDQQGKTEYFYATLADITNSIREPLAKHGLSYRWEIDEKQTEIMVTCFITHADGHMEKTVMVGQADNSGKKNVIQQRASTVTYLQRYTLIGALGISSADMDNDGQGGKKEKPLPPPTDKAFSATLAKVMKGEGTVEEVKKFYTLTAEQEQALVKAEQEFKNKK